MSQKTYYFKKLVTVTTDEQIVGLPRLRQVTLQNIGDADCKVELDNPIDSGSTSLTAAQGIPYSWDFGPDKVYVKGSGSTTLLITGVRQFKENPS